MIVIWWQEDKASNKRFTKDSFQLFALILSAYLRGFSK